MSYSTTLIFTTALVRQSVWAFWKRTVGITFPLVLLSLSAYLVWLVRAGNTSWIVGFVAAILVLGYGFLVLLYMVHLRQSMATLRAMGSPQATLEIDAEGFTVASGAGRATVPWRITQEVWRFPGFWLLLLSRSQFMTLPLNNLPDAMQAKILEQVQQHGGKVL